MDLRTFGDLALGEGTFTRPKPLLLLAYLAVEGPQDRRFLAELFWPNAAQPRRSLAVALARLRSGAPGAVEVGERRVRCTVPSDVAAFLAHAERGEPLRAVELYRGPFLHGLDPAHPGVELEEWLYATRELLAVRAGKAMLDVAEREAGLRRYAGAARRAGTALGWVDPATLEPDDVVRLHTVLRAAEDPRAAELAREVEGFGLDLVGSVEQARTRLGRTPVAAGARTLPAPGTAFVGRDLELTELATALAAEEEGRLLTLVGPAGAGKTRLALQVAREQLATGAYRDGVHVVPLESVREPDRIPAAVAEALGLQPGLGREPLASLMEDLRDADALLVVDNVEHLAAGAAALAELVRGCPGLRVLATSRGRLHLHDERVFTLEGMPLPAGASDPETARRADAVRLFVQRAKRAQPDFALDEATLPHVLRICRALEGLPLLLELAAAWVRVMPCEAIAREIVVDLDLLSTEARDVPDRHRSLRGAFEHSWGLLTPTERDVLARLAVFRGGFERDAAAEVAGATLPLLASLVDKSLLRVTPAWRYDRHPLLHAFTEEKLADDPEVRRRARRAHAEHYARRLQASQADLAGDGDRQARALRFIDLELENVREAWRWLLEHDRVAQLARGSEALHRLLQHRGRHRDGVDMLREALDGLHEHDAEHRAAAGALRTALAVLRYHLGDLEAAEATARDGLERLPHEAQGPEVHRGLNVRAMVAWRRGAYAEARAHWERALAWARPSGNTGAVHMYLVNLAMIERSEGKFAQAEAYLLEALELTRARDHQLNAVLVLNNLGELALLTGDAATAEARLEEALRSARALGVSDVVPMCLLNLALAAYERNALERAAHYTDEALEAVRGSGQGTLEIGALALAGRVAAARGHEQRAHEAFRQCLRLLPSSTATSMVLKALGWWAEWHVRAGRPERALPILEHAARHPSTEPDDRRDAKRWLQRARRAAGGAAPAGAGSGKALDLEGLVAQVARDVSV